MAETSMQDMSNDLTPSTTGTTTESLLSISHLPPSTLSALAHGGTSSSVLPGPSGTGSLNVPQSDLCPPLTSGALTTPTTGSRNSLNPNTTPNDIAPGVSPYSPPRLPIPANTPASQFPDSHQPNFEDATRLFERLKTKSQEDPDVYHLILSFIGDLLNPEMNTLTVTDRVSDLLGGRTARHNPAISTDASPAPYPALAHQAIPGGPLPTLSPFYHENSPNTVHAAPALQGEPPLIPDATPAASPTSTPGPAVHPDAVPDPKGGPMVEFNQAVNYVNKIKQRFASDPDTYRQFLEILQTYQKEQHPIAEVYRQVNVLFNNQRDLLEDFQVFLPDTGAAGGAGSVPSQTGGEGGGAQVQAEAGSSRLDDKSGKDMESSGIGAPLTNTIGSDANNMPTSAHNTQALDAVLSGQMSCEEMFQKLVDHGCVNLLPHMDPDHYSSGLIVGGGFGDIWKGKLRNGTEVAIKVWRFTSIQPTDPKSMKRAMREIYHWSRVKHQNIQELMGVIMFQGRLGMVSLWMHEGNLRQYIHKYPNVDRYSLCAQVARGVSYLHDQGMVHGDLKAVNILVSKDGVAKLSDFDHSIMAECSLVFSETSKLGGGTTRWMAPELILESNSCRNEHTDIYALGMTVLEIITGDSPYYPECKEDVQVIKAVMQGSLPKRQTTHFSDNTRDNRMWELLLHCWSREPTTRPTAVDVYESLSTLTIGSG